MIKIEKAAVGHSEFLADLGRNTYEESHGHFISNKDDLQVYLDNAFSLQSTKRALLDTNNFFFLIFYKNQAIGYAKLVFGESHKKIKNPKICRLEKIYISNKYIPLKVGQKLLEHVEQTARDLHCNSIWLSVYVKNDRAIRFYQRNEYQEVGMLDFKINNTPYDNLVLSKNIS